MAGPGRSSDIGIMNSSQTRKRKWERVDLENRWGLKVFQGGEEPRLIQKRKGEYDNTRKLR